MKSFFSIYHLVGPVNCPVVFPSNLWANIHPLLKPLFRLISTWNGRWSRNGPDIIFCTFLGEIIFRKVKTVPQNVKKGPHR